MKELPVPSESLMCWEQREPRRTWFETPYGWMFISPGPSPEFFHRTDTGSIITVRAI